MTLPDRIYRTLPLAVVLTLGLSMMLPSSFSGISLVHAFNQDPNTPTTFLPFGPEVDQVVFQYYSDFSTMFNAFATGGSGGLDITDWPLFASDSGINIQPGSLCDPSLHPDFYCSAPSTNFGLFQLDINHDRAFLGVNQLQPRTTLSVHVTQGSSTSACSVGLGSITVQLHNQETSAIDALFDVNNMTLTQVLSGGLLGGTTTVGGTGKHGLYSFPCVVAGKYLLSNSAYANCPSGATTSCEINIASASTSSADFFSNWNSASTQMYTQAGIYIRQAFRHLLDKNQFILSSTLQGQAQCTDIYAARPQGFGSGFCSGVPGLPKAPLPTDILKAECPTLAAQDSFFAANCNPVDSYTLNEGAIGSTGVWWAADGSAVLADNGYPSEQDIRAACDLFKAAGFSLTPSGATCTQVAAAAQGTAIPSSYPHLLLPASGAQIIFYIRTHPPRRAFGTIVEDGLNFLFGTANRGANPGGGNPAGSAPCAVNLGFKSPGSGCTGNIYYGFSEISDIVFADGVNAQTWNLYTGGESFSINPDNEYSTFNSQFASNYCGGVQALVISNYDVACDPKLDAYTNAGEFADTFLHAINIFQNASYVSTLGVSANPVYNLLQRFISLNSLNFGNTLTSQGSLVNGLGTGWQAGTTGAFSTLLNAHCNPNYTPANSAFACGGGNSHTLRRGQSQDSDSFSPYTATSVWDFDVIDMIWDSMLILNPNTGGPTIQLSNWMVTSHTSIFNPAETSCSPGQGCVLGTTTQIWHLRPDLQFHDGTPVTADDVVFSLLTYRDIPAALLQPNVINIASATAINPSTVQVKLTLSGPFYDDLVGLIPILPHHAWAAACFWPVGAPEPPVTTLQVSQCANPNFDPMAIGLMIGSGPYECLALPGAPSGLPAGTPGGTCSQTASGIPSGQSNTLGGTLLLTANPNYDRGPVANQGSRYQKFAWADKFNQGIVTIADISDAALHFKQYDPYWAHPLFSSTTTCSATGGPGTGTLQCVDVGVISTIALYNHVGATDPLSLSSAVGLDPTINRFSSSGITYLATKQTSPTTLTIDTVGAAATTVTATTGTSTVTCTRTTASGPGRTTYSCTFTAAISSPIYIRITTISGVIVVKD